jgi:tetratricopeptide (TPR) repeat protein
MGGTSLRLNGLGFIAKELGRFDEGRAYHQRALEILEQVKHKAGVGQTLTNLAALELEAGAPAAGRAYARRALELQREIGDAPGVSQSLRILAQFALEEGNLTWGARMLGAASKLDPRQVPSPEEVLSRIASPPDAADLRQQVDGGRALSLGEAVEEALGI